MYRYYQNLPNCTKQEEEEKKKKKKKKKKKLHRPRTVLL